MWCRGIFIFPGVIKEGVSKLNKKKKNRSIIIVALISGIAIFFICFFVFGKKDTKGKKEISDHVLTWIVSDDFSLDKRKIQKLNETLYQDGYDFAVRFKTLQANSFMDHTYKDGLEKQIKEGKADIVYGGSINENDTDWVEEFCNKGYYYELDAYLKTKEGKKLYRLYPEEYWERTSMHKKHYAMPNTSFDLEPTAVQISKEYIQEEKAASWDGSYTSLCSMIEDAKIPKNVLPVYPLRNITTLALQNGYDCLYDIFLDCTREKAVNPFSTNCLYSYFRFLHHAYQKGWIPKETSMNDTGIDEKTNAQIKAQRVAIDMGVGLENSDKFVTYYQKEHMINSTSALTFICNASSQKENAIQLLSLLRRYNKYSNLLLWGEEGKDYTISNNIATGIKGNTPDFFTVFNMGLKEHIYGTDQQDKNVKKENEKWLHSKYYQQSKLIGFHLDTTALKKEINQYRKVVQSEYDCWKEKDFEKAYKKAKKRVEKKGQVLFQKVNQQIKEQK